MTLVLPMTGFHRLTCRNAPSSTGPAGSAVLGGTPGTGGWGADVQGSGGGTSNPPPHSSSPSPATAIPNKAHLMTVPPPTRDYNQHRDYLNRLSNHHLHTKHGPETWDLSTSHGAAGVAHGSTPTQKGAAAATLLTPTPANTQPSPGNKRKFDPESRDVREEPESSRLRRAPCRDVIDVEPECIVRPRRISAMWNTPKQRRDDKRKVLRISLHKLRQIDDPEHFLRRSVLINNTMKRMQQEIRDEKCHGYGHFYNLHSHHADIAAGMNRGSAFVEPRDTLPRRGKNPYHHPLVHPASRQGCMGGATSYLSANAHLFDDVYTQTDDDYGGRITDDMTDRLVRSLEQNSEHCNNASESRDRSTNVTQNSVTADEVIVNNNNNTSNLNNNSLPINSPPKTTNNLSYLGKLNNNNIKNAPCSVNEKQLLGDIDAVFNNLICALAADT